MVTTSKKVYKSSIAILVPCLGYGGAERQISLIAPFLQTLGNKVIVISMIPAVAYDHVLEAANITLYNGKFQQGKYSVKYFMEIKKILNREKINVLITFNYPANISGRILKLLRPRVKLLTSFRSIRFGSRARTKLISMTNFIDDLTITNSTYVAQYFAKRGILSNRKARVIPNAFDPIFLQQTQEQSLEAKTNSPHNFYWITIGRFEEAKDYPTLIDAAYFLKNNLHQTDFKIYIIGDGTLANEIFQKIKEFNLNNNVILLGRQPNVVPYLIQAQAFVLSSAWEGLPNAVMEAMACGLPVVSTLAGGVRDIVSHGKNGLLVPTKEPRKLAEAMAEIMSLPEEERKKIGQLNKEFISSYSLAQVGRKWEDAILSVTDGNEKK